MKYTGVFQTFNVNAILMEGALLAAECHSTQAEAMAEILFLWIGEKLKGR